MNNELKKLKDLLREGVDEIKSNMINITIIMKENEQLKQEITRLRDALGYYRLKFPDMETQPKEIITFRQVMKEEGDE